MSPSDRHRKAGTRWAVTSYWSCRSLHRELTIHYAPSDPAVYTPDLAGDRRDNERAIGWIIILLVTGLAAVSIGAALL
ncbi:hypothetical protein [Streptomyces sp. NPDC048256]|uniref:hypothetical protein n=1 Tax=Streptomyces sp. NPDC048256 TaxID=3154613 RepID=UPI0033EE86A8